MKKKVFLILFALTIIGATVACKSFVEAAKSNDSTTVAQSEEVSAESEYEALTIKTDWDSMADVIFTDEGMTINGEGCTDEDGVLYITEGGEYTLTGTSTACSIVVNTDENVKLVLNGVDLTSVNGPVIYGQQVKNLYIELADGTTNTLTDSESYATDNSTGEEIGKGTISSEDDIIILGTGTLNVYGNHGHGIVSDDKLYIEDGIINITTTVTDGLHANDLISIDGGTISIDAASDIMESEDALIINNGTIIGTSQDEGIESKNTISINGGSIDISVTDDGLNATTSIEINDGTINIETDTGDGIDCNGNYEGCITINGGYVYVKGGNSPEGGIDADNASAIINGGKVIAIGDANSPISEKSQQVSIIYGSFNANETITITDSEGNTVFEYAPEVSGSTMIISAAELVVGETYTIYANGSQQETVTADSTVVEAGGSASGMGGMQGGKGGRFGGQGMLNELTTDGQMQNQGFRPNFQENQQ